jgi:hypothetical protein
VDSDNQVRQLHEIIHHNALAHKRDSPDKVYPKPVFIYAGERGDVTYEQEKDFVVRD